MKSKYAAVRLATLIAFALFSYTTAFAKTVLPDACGDVKTQFEIKEEKDHPPPAGPEAGKAMLVFVGTVPTTLLGALPPIRYGLDGQWAGATKGKSYFAKPVSAGQHHLCAAFHAGPFKAFKAAVPVDMTAEAGKVYYYEAIVNVVNDAAPMVVGGGAAGQPPPTVSGGGGSISFIFVPLSDAEGQYRVKAWKLSVSTPKH